MVGRQTPLLALVVPLVLVFIVDGRRGVRQTWLPALVAGFVFAITQFVTANYISVQLTDIVASLLSAGSLVLLVRVWQPTEMLTAERAAAEESVRDASPAGSSQVPGIGATTTATGVAAVAPPREPLRSTAGPTWCGPTLRTW